MTENQSSILKIQMINLHNYYKKYVRNLLFMQKHVERLYGDWIIDISYRNSVLQKLDVLVRKMLKFYNRALKYTTDDSLIVRNEDIYIRLKNDLDLLKINDPNYFNDMLNNDPFALIRKELLNIGYDIGFYNMTEFFNIYLLDHNLLSIDIDNGIYDLYDQVFIPINMKINNYHKCDFTITPITLEFDSLIDNTAMINMSVNNIKLNVSFEGYIASDNLNILVRSSQIYSEYIFKNKTKFIELLNKNKMIDEQFKIRCINIMNGSCYFIYTSELLIEKIKNDYHRFMNMSMWNSNNLIKEFISADIKDKYRIINILMMGNENNVHSAVMLFNALKDKKVSGENLSDIIYHNLSFNAQLFIKKTSIDLKEELSRVRSLTCENIPIEKRIVVNVDMPDNVKAYIMEKLLEIKSGETNYKVQMAINGLMQFPWKPVNVKNEYSDIRKSMELSRNYLKNVAQKLDESVFGHMNSKRALIELVGKWINNPSSNGQVIGLVGPPGIGKTLLAKSISSALNIPLSIIGLGGMSDASDLIGHSYTYTGAQYGMILRQMIKAGNWRSVLLFDEVDKAGKRSDINEIYNTLIHVTDSNLNQKFQDRFYSSAIDFDLSGVLIVFSYNNSEKLDPILLDRIQEINISEYTLHEKVIICRDYIIKELCENMGFPREKINICNEVIKYIIEKYTREAGVRDLKRKIEKILMKLNIDRYYLRGPFREIVMKRYYAKYRGDHSRRISNEDGQGLEIYLSNTKSKTEEQVDKDTLNKIFNFEMEEQIHITIDLVHKYLDRPTILNEELQNEDSIGVINGLYESSMGIGGIVPIQIYKNYVGDYSDGINIKLKLTGNQKQVMKESVVCALTAVINLLNKNIISKITEDYPNGFHIHAPDGCTPKDGPSAGCAFATAFVSILLGKKINRFVAMTGEIELTGKISKIGGLQAKLQGAKKAGIKKVFICDANMDDYKKIKYKSPELFNDLEIIVIKHIIEIVSDPEIIIGVCPEDFDENVRSKIIK